MSVSTYYSASIFGSGLGICNNDVEPHKELINDVPSHSWSVISLILNHVITHSTISGLSIVSCVGNTAPDNEFCDKTTIIPFIFMPVPVCPQYVLLAVKTIKHVLYWLACSLVFNTFTNSMFGLL